MRSSGLPTVQLMIGLGGTREPLIGLWKVIKRSGPNWRMAGKPEVIRHRDRIGPVKRRYRNVGIRKFDGPRFHVLEIFPITRDG